jgi:hypothetical protein
MYEKSAVNRNEPSPPGKTAGIPVKYRGPACTFRYEGHMPLFLRTIASCGGKTLRKNQKPVYQVRGGFQKAGLNGYADFDGSYTLPLVR